jgi:ABC-2 type transport system permease protein
MMGKIIGIMLVGLTQFIIWVGLSFVCFFVLSIMVFPDMLEAANQAEMMQTDMGNNVAMNNEFADLIFRQINWPLMIGLFIFYFIGGYLLYGSLMAAVGSAVDNESDTQQFILPISAPLIFAYIIAVNIVGNPHGSVAFWCSEIPFTSPVVMLVRVAIGGEGMVWQVILSMFLLIITFIGSTWFAGKIYRTGILMYGKKISYKEILKWLRYKN